MPSNPAITRGYIAHSFYIQKLDYYNLLVSTDGLVIDKISVKKISEFNNKVHEIIVQWLVINKSTITVPATRTDLKEGFRLLETASKKIIDSNFSLSMPYFEKLIHLLKEINEGSPLSFGNVRPKRSKKWLLAIQNNKLAYELWFQLRRQSGQKISSMLTPRALVKEMQRAKRNFKKELSKEAKETLIVLSTINPKLHSTGYRVDRLDQLIIPLSKIWMDHTKRSAFPNRRYVEKQDLFVEPEVNVDERWLFLEWVEKVLGNCEDVSFLNHRPDIEKIIKNIQ